MTFTGMLKGSILCRFLWACISAFLRAYENSRLKLFLGAVSNCFKESCVHCALSRYVNKKAYFRYSLIYKLIMAVVHIVDKIFAFVNKIGSRLIGGSGFCNEVKSTVNSELKDKLNIVGILFVSVSIGSFIAAILRDGLSNGFLFGDLAVLALGIVVIAVAHTLSVFKESLIFKALRELFIIIGE